MARKAFINACFHLCFVVLFVRCTPTGRWPMYPDDYDYDDDDDDDDALTSCIDKIRKILERAKGRMLSGGYMAIENPQDDDDVKSIVASGLKEAYNQRTNDIQRFELFENGTIEAYSQVVNGQNFCVEFTVVSVGCIDSIDPCHCRNGKKVACSVEAYMSTGEKEPRINRDTLTCTNLA